MKATRQTRHRDIRWHLQDRGSGKAVLLLHSVWGLHAGMEAIGQRLAREGFAVAMPDLYGGAVPATLKEAEALRLRPRRQPAYRLLVEACEGLLAWTGAPTLGVMGFSLGAHWAVWLSQRSGLPVTAAVLFYGARGGDFAASHADFQCHFAGEDDPYVSPAARHRMLGRLAEAGRPVQVFEYPRCGHWFAEKGVRDSYSPASARLALGRAARFLGGMAPKVGELALPSDGRLQAAP
jgi:carboxymethylenebutenolidase